MFILKTRDYRKLTQAALDGILEDVTELLQAHIQHVLEKILDVLNSSNVGEQVVSAISSIFAEERFSKPFLGLETEYRQNRYFRDHFGMVVSHFDIFLTAKVQKSS